MRKNPLNKGIIMKNAAGVGSVTPAMVEARARELALINGHGSTPNEADWQEAKRGLSGESIHRRRTSSPCPNRKVGMWCPARPDVKQQNLSVKMKMPRDGARARRCSQKASAKQSTIKCFAPQRRMSRTTKNNYREVCAYLASGDGAVVLRDR